MQAALELIGQGRVATIYGRLRPGVVVVDVDVDHATDGQAITTQIATWTQDAGLWHLVRPSGGDLGRAHVFVVVGDRRSDLEDAIDELRCRWRVSGTQVQVRVDVRPLSAPHRYGGCPAPRGSLHEAIASLPAWITDSPPGATATLRGRRARHPERAPLVPRPRHRHDLPTAWADYLTEGQTPSVGGTDTSRSTIEAIATATMIRAGWTHEQAWTAITTAHPAAMSKARGRGRAWWTRHVWDPAVATDHDRDQDVASRRTGHDDPAILAAVTAARAALSAHAWTLTPRRRASLLHVGHTVLDRIQRTSALRVPVPERDLTQDTGLSRRTIRAALRALHGPVGTLHTDVLDRSPAARATTSHEFSIAPVPLQGVREIAPPRCHTPLPRLAPGTWHLLPPTAPQLWRALHANTSGLTLEEIAVAAQLVEQPIASPTPSQRRTARSALQALAQAGLARCDAQGRWTPCSAATPQHRELAAHEHALHHAAIVAERDAYRRGHGSTWAAQQRAALLEVEQRYARWRAALPREERTERTVQWQMIYAGLSIHEQEQVKDRLASRRRRAGFDETQRLNAWIDAWTDEQWEQRVTQRAAACATLAPPERAALVAAWQRHRDRHHLPIGRRSPDRAIAPGHTDRDDAFLHSQSAPEAHTEATLHA